MCLHKCGLPLTLTWKQISIDLRCLSVSASVTLTTPPKNEPTKKTTVWTKRNERFGPKNEMTYSNDTTFHTTISICIKPQDRFSTRLNLPLQACVKLQTPTFTCIMGLNYESTSGPSTQVQADRLYYFSLERATNRSHVCLLQGSRATSQTQMLFPLGAATGGKEAGVGCYYCCFPYYSKFNRREETRDLNIETTSTLSLES